LLPLSSSYSSHHRHLHSFPTRRSSDLQPRVNPANQAYLNMLAVQNAANVQQTFNNQLQQVYSSQFYGSPVNPVTFPNFYPSYPRSEEHTSELQSQSNLVCRLLLEKKKK